MNKKNLIALCITGSIFANPLSAADIFQKFTRTHHKSSQMLKAPSTIKALNINNFTNFSGTWVGTCSYEPSETITMTIKNSDTELNFDGMDMTIGSLNTFSTADAGNTQISHVLAEWDTYRSTLQFHHAFVDYDHSDNDSVEKLFMSGTSSMALKNEQLVLDINFQSPEGNVEGVCTFSKE